MQLVVTITITAGAYDHMYSLPQEVAITHFTLEKYYQADMDYMLHFHCNETLRGRNIYMAIDIEGMLQVVLWYFLIHWKGSHPPSIYSFLHLVWCIFLLFLLLYMLIIIIYHLSILILLSFSSSSSSSSSSYLSSSFLLLILFMLSLLPFSPPSSLPHARLLHLIHFAYGSHMCHVLSDLFLFWIYCLITNSP